VIAGLRPYPSYQDSGVEWLGDLPTHWTLRRTKTVLLERSSKGFPNQPLLAATQTRGVVRKEHYENRTVLALRDLHLLKLVHKGDFVISLRSFQGGLECARHQGIISPAYTVLYPRDERNRAYLSLVFKSKPYIDNLRLFVTGIRQGQSIDYAKLSRSPLPCPPLTEQEAIARFLDHVDRRIQRTITAKEKRIALLEEQKKAIIHQAVTGQIDVRTGKPYPAYKQSGVAWFGRVPAHWGVRRLRTLASVTTGGRDTVDRHDEGTYPFFVRSQTVERINSWSFDGEAVLTAGDGVGVGRVFHYAKGKFDFHQRVYKFSDFGDVLGRYFFHYIRASLRFEVMQGTAKSTVDSLRLPRLRGFPVAVPSPADQSSIANFLDAYAARMDKRLDNVRYGICLLREYRTRLIADVVTGKLDVREAAAALPDTAPV